MKECSIIIPTKDKLSRLYLTLKCLECQMTDNIEVIIVFDGCKEETVSAFRKLTFSFKPVEVVLTVNVGRAGARNEGMKRASGEVYIFLDDDRLVEQDFIEKHLAYQRKSPCVVLGERYNSNYTEQQLEAFMNEGNIEDTLEKVKQDAYVEVYFRVKKKFLTKRFYGVRYLGLMTGNISIHKEIMALVGGFDANFKGWGYEDTELAYRLAKAGVSYITDYNIPCYHMLHERNLKVQRKEELINRDYFMSKFKEDKLLQFILFLYGIKARVNL